MVATRQIHGVIERATATNGEEAYLRSRGSLGHRGRPDTLLEMWLVSPAFKEMSDVRWAALKYPKLTSPGLAECKAYTEVVFASFHKIIFTVRLPSGSRREAWDRCESFVEEAQRAISFEFENVPLIEGGVRTGVITRFKMAFVNPSAD